MSTPRAGFHRRLPGSHLGRLLIALLSASFLLQQSSGVTSFLLAGPAPRQCEGAPAEDANPVDDADPSKGVEGEAVAVAIEPRGRLPWAAARPLDGHAWLPWPRTTSERRPPRHGPVTSSLPAAGRALRHWLQSQVC
jgi:hypothetical protein